MLIDAASGNLKLSAGSPCIDIGANTVVPTDTVDIDGNRVTIEIIP